MIITSFGKDTNYLRVIVVIFWCRKIFRESISEKYYSLEFSSLTIVVNSEHFYHFKTRGKPYEKDRERYWFLEAGPTLAPSQPWTKCYGLQLVHWSQWTKRAIYIFFCNSKFWFLITLYTFSGSIELLFYSIFFLHTMYKDSFV